jgi:UDP-GlcNAc:undecaprenyl-phosphate/decaprenyl-phosphate GlcNAc-1-phosphate transferase
MVYLLIFFSSLIITIFSTPYLISLFRRRNILDLPGARKIHVDSIPRMGGIVIYVVAVFILFSYAQNLNSIRLIFVSSAIVIFCGMMDDLRSLKWHTKFLFQAIATINILYFFEPQISSFTIFSVGLPAPISLFVLGVFMIGVMNSLNLMDGMDGLVSGFSLLIFLIIFLFASFLGNYFLMILTATLAGSTLGFLKFNAYPARIFLGDTGSLILGFFLALTTIILSLDAGSGVLDLTFPVILLGVPIMDTLKVMVVRLFRKKHIFLADNSHLHHVIFNNKVRHKTTVFFILIISALFIVAALNYLRYSQSIGISLFILLSLLVVFMEPMLNLMTKLRIVEITYGRVEKIPIRLVDLLERYFIGISSGLVILLFANLFPGEANLDRSVITVLLITGFTLMFVSFYSKKKTKVYNDLYVLINMLIFISIAHISDPFIPLFLFKGIILKSATIFFFVVLITFISFFIVARERIFAAKISLLTGFDLVVLVLITISAVLQNYFSILNINFLGAHLLLGFIIYLWYKIIIAFNHRYRRYLYYTSFAIPIVSLFVIFITSV